MRDRDETHLRGYVERSKAASAARRDHVLTVLQAKFERSRADANAQREQIREGVETAREPREPRAPAEKRHHVKKAVDKL